MNYIHISDKKKDTTSSPFIVLARHTLNLAAITRNNNLALFLAMILNPLYMSQVILYNLYNFRLLQKIKNKK